MANPLPRQSQTRGTTVINPTPLQDPATLRTVLVCCKDTWMLCRVTENSLRQYFTNSAASGGGPVERVVTLNVRYTGVVHFRNHQDAVNVVCRDNHACQGVPLSVFLYDEQSGSVYSGRHTVSSRDSLKMSVHGVDYPLVDREASTTVLVTGVGLDVTDYNVESALGCERRHVLNIKRLRDTWIAVVQFQHHEDALRAVGMKQARVAYDLTSVLRPLFPGRIARPAVVNLFLFLFRGPIPDHTNPQHKTKISVINQQEDVTMMLPANKDCTLSKDHTDTVKPQTVQFSAREVSQPEVVREGRQWRQELLKLDFSQLETLARAGGSTDDVMAVWKRYPPENYKKVLINTCLATVSGSELVKVVLSLVSDLTLLVTKTVGHNTSVETDTSPGDPISTRHDMATQTNTPGTVSATQTESLEMDSATHTDLLAADDVSADMLPVTPAVQAQVEFQETLTQHVHAMLENQEARSLAQTRLQNRQIQSLLQQKVQMEAKLAAMQSAFNQLESRLENQKTGLEAGSTQLKDEMHQMQNEIRSDFQHFKTQLRDDARDQRSDTNELRSDVSHLFSQQRQLRSEFNQNQAQHRADVMQQETQLQHQLQTIMDTVNTQTQASLQMQDRMHKNQMLNLVGEMRNIKTEVIGIRSQLAAQADQTTRQVQATNRAEPTMLVLAIANTSDCDSTSGDSSNPLPVD